MGVNVDCKTCGERLVNGHGYITGADKAQISEKNRIRKGVVNLTLKPPIMRNPDWCNPDWFND